MKNLTLIILFGVAVMIAAVGAFLKIMTKGTSIGNEVMIAALCLKAIVLVIFFWKYRNSIIPWLKQ